MLANHLFRVIVGKVIRRRLDLLIEGLIKATGVPVVDPADDLAIDDIDRTEDSEFAAEQLWRVGKLDEDAPVTAQNLRRI